MLVGQKKICAFNMKPPPWLLPDHSVDNGRVDSGRPLLTTNQFKFRGGHQVNKHI